MTAEPHEDPREGGQRAAQRARALASAQRVRLARARFKHELASRSGREGYQLLARMLDREEPMAMSMGAAELLLAVRGIGAVRARVILRAADVRWPGIKVRDLTPRQRHVIATMLRTLRTS